MKVDDTASSVLGKNIELSITDAERLYNTGNFQDFSYNRVATRVGQEMLLQTAKIPVALVGTAGQIPYAISTAGKSFEEWVAADEEHTMGYGQGLSNISQAIKETRIPQEESDKQREEALRKEMQQAGFFKTGLPKRVEPESGVIFDGQVGVKIMDKAKALGDVLMSASNRTLEEMNREAEKVMVKLSPEEQESLTYKFSQVGVNYATMLGLSTLSPAAGLNYMTALTLAGETEEGFETYKAQNKGSFEGYSEQAGQDFWSNIINTGVQRRIENLIGVPAQVRFFRNAKEFGKAMLVGGGGELLEEELQNLTDDIIDDFNGRLEGQVDKNGNPLTWWSKWVSQITDINAVAIGAFGAMGGAAFAAHNRAAVKSEIRSFVEQRVEPNKVEQVVDAVYNSADLTIKNVLAKEIEYTSSLQSKRGDVYESLHKAFSEAVRDARERGAFPELLNEEEVADYVTTLTNSEADKLLVEAKARGTTVAEMVDARLIEFKNGKLILPMTKGVTSEKATYYEFGGKSALTADESLLRQAQNMELNDATPEEIWQETGWKRGKDGEWRFEISDDEAFVNFGNAPTDTEVTLADVLEHEKLYNAYPQLKDIPVIVDTTLIGSGHGAEYENGRIRINPESYFRKDKSLKQTLLHEIQHAIQRIEGFARGGSPQYFADKETREVFRKFLQEEDTKKYNQAVLDLIYEEVAVDQANKISDADEKLEKASKDLIDSIETDNEQKAEELYDDAKQELDEALEEAGKTAEWLFDIKTKARKKAGLDVMLRSVRANLYSPTDIYMNLYGEREARMTEERAGMTEEERRAYFPEYEEGAIVLMPDGEVTSADVISQEYNPREEMPNVRGGWTKAKILRYLKDWGSRRGVGTATRMIAEFDNVEDFKSHMFYHGAKIGTSGSMKPSITMSDRQVESIGGGGYGEKYWAISLSKSKKVAGNFATAMGSGNIYPVLLAKNAKVIEMPELSDSADLEDHIVDLYNQGVDAVWIGDKESGEQELAIINPRAIVNIGTSEFYRAYKLGQPENPINIKSDEEIQKIYDFAKDFAKEFPKTVPDEKLEEARKIVHWQDNRGVIEFEGDKALITLTERADSTTLPHELAHYYLQNTFLYTKSGLASPEYMENFKQIAKYLGITEDQETIKEWQQEKFARAYEMYQMGKAPEGMEIPLTKYQEWLRSAYGKMQQPMYRDENGEMKVPEFDYDTMKMFASLAGETLTEPQFKETQERVRGLAKTTSEMAKQKGIETETPMYEPRSSTEMGKKADEFIKENKQLAIDIVKGLAPEQDGLFRQDLFAALRELALNEGDSDLLNELSRSMTVEEATELGQRIQALARGTVDPVKQMTELRDERMKKNKVTKKEIKEETKKATKEIKKEIALAAQPKEWQDFIKSLEC